jgi:radical SAM protein with 4Fe4S-binding SPASM domain
MLKLISNLGNRTGLYKTFLGKQSKSYGLPNIFIIETTNHCDRKCQICPHQSLERPKGFMDLGLYQRIIDQIPQAELVFPYFLGEPLLHKDIYAMIKYSKSKGLYTSISTGGKLLNEDNCRKLVEAGLDHLQISLHSTNEEGYETIDSKADFETLLSNIDRFLAINNGKIDFYISIINIDSGIKDWKRFAEEWKKKGAKVRFKFFTDWNSDKEAIKKFVNFRPRQKSDVYPCDWLWQQFHILWDGRVVPCCFDYDGTHVLGDVNKDSIKTIWNGPAYRQIREAHLVDGSSVKLCAKCSRRKKPWYEMPFHVFFDASLIYKMRLYFEKKPRKNFG